MQKRLYTKGFYTHKNKTVKNPASVVNTDTLPVVAISNSKTKVKDEKLIASNSKSLISNSKLLTGCDTIILRGGARITANIIEANQKEIVFKSCDATTGSNTYLKRDDISYIVYANGRKEFFEADHNYNEPQNLPKDESVNYQSNNTWQRIHKTTNLFAILGFVLTFLPYPFSLVCLGIILFASILSGSIVQTQGFNGKDIGIGWYALFFTLAATALTFCILALIKIKKSKGTEKGKTLAILGIIFNLLLIVSLIAIYFTFIH